MKTCLVAINSKYIHTSPAVHSLQAFAMSRGCTCDVLEFTINQTDEQILKGLYRADADIYAFSVYIWNITTVMRLAESLIKVKPGIKIWLGGPEVSYESESILKEHDCITGIIRGEGEETFAELLKAYDVNIHDANKDGDDANTFCNGSRLNDICGITFRDETGIVSTPDRAPLDMDELVFPYFDKKLDEHRIYYYESSRGCPFNCSYCLSSADKKVRFKSMDKVEIELGYFIEQNIPQVKFVDRTFNCNKSHAMAIWQYIKSHDNGITNFHFEIGADLLDDEELKLLSSLRPGQIQLEIGVQTTNPETMKAINRYTSWDKLAQNVKALLGFNNIHIHLDLIAGLPYEDLESFKKSFDDVYGIKPLQLQLGFLKVLKGTEMDAKKDEYDISGDGYAFAKLPPYEVLHTPWMSYDDILELKGVEEMVEVYYNSRQFERTIVKLEENFDTYYELYHQLSVFYENRHYFDVQHARIRRYEILLEFIDEKKLDRDMYIPLLLEDAYARERLKHFPEWALGYHFENTFDYDHRSPLTGNAKRV